MTDSKVKIPLRMARQDIQALYSYVESHPEVRGLSRQQQILRAYLDGVVSLEYVKLRCKTAMNELIYRGAIQV